MARKSTLLLVCLFPSLLLVGCGGNSSKCNPPEQLDCESADLFGANLRGANSESTNLIGAELSAAAEALERYRLRVSGLVDTVGPDNEDLVSALYEAERALLGAQRLVARAGKMAR